MRTYYSFTIFAELACELNTNQKNDLQTQSAFCQVCLLVSGQSTFFLGYFQQIMQSISAEKRPKNVQNPSVCKRFMISGSVSESWVFQSNGRPELVPAVLDKVLALAATVECLQISFLGLGSAKMIYKQFLRFYKQLLEFYKQFLEFYKQFLEFYKQFLEFWHSQRIETPKNLSPKGRRHPSRQSETSKSGKPVTEKVLAAMVRRGTRYRSLRLQKRNFRFQGLPRTYSILQPESGDGCGLSIPGISQATRYGVLVRKGLRKKNSSNRQSHPGDDAQSQSGPCKLSAGMPRFGFETLYAPPQLDHCVSWEGRQFVAHFANQRNSGVLTILISAFPFYNTTWSLTLTLMLLFTCWTHPKIFIQC